MEVFEIAQIVDVRGPATILVGSIGYQRSKEKFKPCRRFFAFFRMDNRRRRLRHQDGREGAREPLGGS